MNNDQLDAHLDAILKAGGSALRHYTTQKPKDDMRAALLLATHPAPGVLGMSDRTHFTYKNQPFDNVICWRLGEAARSSKPGGDLIDHGLSLLRELEKRGYGIFMLTAAQAKGGEHG